MDRAANTLEYMVFLDTAEPVLNGISLADGGIFSPLDTFTLFAEDQDSGISLNSGSTVTIYKNGAYYLNCHSSSSSCSLKSSVQGLTVR